MLLGNEKRSRFSIETFEANEAWVHGANLRGWSHVYEPAKPGPFKGTLRVAWLGPIQIVHERIEQPFKYYGRPWPGARILFSFLSGSCGLLCNGRPIGVDSVVSHRWDTVERFSCSRAVEAVLVAIDEKFLNEQTAHLGGSALFAKDGAPTILNPGPGQVSIFQRCLLETLQELHRNPALLADEHARHAFQRRILDAVAGVAVTRADRQRLLPPPSTRAYIVEHAIDYIGSALADPISIADVCEKLRVCPRTLGYSFTTVLGVSPMRHLLAMRLNRTRRDLAAAGSDASIQAIAGKWGFSHMGRFAQQYRQAFGERPSDTCGKATLHQTATIADHQLLARPQERMNAGA